jgi:glycosyltransferase involved in cell wall biosynthesis
MAERYSKLHKLVEIIRNFPDLSCGEFDSVSLYDRKPACVFAGTLKQDRNLANMVRAIGLLRKRNVTLQLWLAGKWESAEYEHSIWRLATEEGVSDQVHYSGILSHKDAVALESRGSIGMVTLLPIPNTLKTLPIKLFECMGLGLPVIYSDFPLLQRYVREYGVGVAVDPEKPEQIADALEYLVKNPQIAQQMGTMGKRAVMEKYNWAHEGARLVALYHKILGPRPERM